MITQTPDPQIVLTHRKAVLRSMGYSEAMISQAQQADPDLAKTVQRLGLASPQNRSATIPSTK